jgi:HEAT repeat protein
MDCLRHKEAEVRAVAATTLPAYDRSQHAAQDLADTLRDSNDEVRIAAARSLAHFSGVDDETMVHDLTNALKDDVGGVVFNAARSLTFYGKAAEPATKMLLKRLRRSLVECRDDDARMLIWALDAIVEDTKRTINEFFGDSDAEFRDFSIQMLEQLEAL